MTDPNEKKALQKMEEGDRKLKKNTGFISSIFGGGGSGVSDAIECYISAANYYKVFFQFLIIFLNGVLEVSILLCLKFLMLFSHFGIRRLFRDSKELKIFSNSF